MPRPGSAAPAGRPPATPAAPRRRRRPHPWRGRGSAARSARPGHLGRPFEEQLEAVLLVPLLADAARSRTAGEWRATPRSPGLMLARTTLTAGVVASPLQGDREQGPGVPPPSRQAGSTPYATSTMPRASGGPWKPTTPTTVPSAGPRARAIQSSATGVVGDLREADPPEPGVVDEVRRRGHARGGGRGREVALDERAHRRHRERDQAQRGQRLVHPVDAISAPTTVTKSDPGVTDNHPMSEEGGVAEEGVLGGR